MNAAADPLANTQHDATDARWLSATPRNLLRRPVLIGYLVVALFFGGLGTWAALAQISSATVSFGVVSLEGSRRTVQHLEGGIIAEILVNDGDEVKVGEPLMVLQGTQARASFQVLEGEQQFLAVKLARLLAEQTDKDEVAFPEWLQKAARENAELRQTLASQHDLFTTRQKVHLGRKAIGAKRIDELREEISGLQQQIVSQRRQLKLLDEEITMKKTLTDKGMIPRPELLELERLKAGIQGQIAGNTASVARAKQSIGETELQVVNEDARRLDEVATELAETRSQLAPVNQRLFAQRDVLDRTVVTAPVAGVIVKKRFHTTGGVVGPGEPILDIVPQDEQLLIDARIRPVDIDEVAADQEARVHFLALIDRRLPQIKGMVRSVSADSLVDDVSGESYYLARVEVRAEELAKLGEGVKITPGMPAEVLIVTGERTFLEYLVQPLLDSLRRSFRES